MDNQSGAALLPLLAVLGVYIGRAIYLHLTNLARWLWRGLGEK